MKKYLEILKKTRLFSGVAEEEIESLLRCLGASFKTFRKGEYVLHQGEFVREVPLLLTGSLHIERVDFWGNRSILSHIGEGEMFGEAYSLRSSEPLLNDVVALEDCELVFFDVKRIITTCPSACRFHTLVVQNMFTAISEKNRKLTKKLSHVSERSTRQKLMSYLSSEAEVQRSAEITIPFNRQQLADFLFVDRSAMSAELSRMRDEGLIQFEKNRFRLL